MDDDKVYFIYVTENLINGKLYIGQHTCKYEDQFTDGYLGSGRAFQNAVKKYGKENFERIIVEYANGPEELNALEAKYVDEEVISDRSRFYNIKTGGVQNVVFSEDCRRRKSESMLKSTIGSSLKKYYLEHPEARLAISNRSKKNWDDPEIRQKMMEGIRKPRSEEAKARMKLSHQNMSDEQRNKISVQSKKNWEDPEYREKVCTNVSKAMKGRTPWNKGKTGCYSEEVRRRKSEANKGKPSPLKGRKYTEGQRKARSEQMKEWYARYKATHTPEEIKRMHSHGGGK